MTDFAEQPNVEAIARALVARLETVTVANGYQVTLAGVVRPLGSNAEEPWSEKHLLAVVQQTDEEPGEAATTQGLTVRRQRFLTAVYLAPESDDDRSFDEWQNVVRADVTKAVMADQILGDATLADVIHEVSVGPAWRFPCEPIEGISIPIEVVYRFNRKDPYS